MSDLTVDEQAYREAIAHFATGVTVITTNVDGEPAGMTASAVASLSLAPVLLLVCISTHLRTHEALERSGRFVVNVLGEDQEELARRGRSVSYALVDAEGPAHDRTFTAAAMIDGVQAGVGRGGSKKDAEQEAAREALESMSPADGDATGAAADTPPASPRSA